MRPAFAPLVGAIGATGLAGNLAACSQIRAGDVASVVMTIRAARSAVVAPEPIEARNWKANPAAFHAWLEHNKPHGNPTISMHAMTPVEFATFRAANLVSDQRMTVTSAISSCRAQALSALRAHPLTPVCQAQNCNPCPPITTRQNVANGMYNILTDNSECTGKSSPNKLYASNGALNAPGTTTLVTINGYPGTNSPIPGSQASTTTQYGNVVTTMPGGKFVPQTGWLALPGQTYNKSQLYEYVDPSSKNVSVSFDSNDWFTGYETSYGGVANDGGQVYSDFGGSTGYSPIVEASTQGDVLSCVGATGAFVTAGILLFSSAVDGPIGALGAAWIFSEIGALGACSSAFDDFNSSAGGGGYSQDYDTLEF